MIELSNNHLLLNGFMVGLMHKLMPN